MDEDNNQLGELSETISKDFNKAGIPSIISQVGFNNLNELKKHLTAKISELLDNNYEKLINILYRIDVDEDKLNELFGSQNRESIPGKLADLIIERQIQKINIRNMYREERKNLPGE
jgi:hypothetical protein